MSTHRYLVRTLGCKANFHDSQILESELQERGWLPAQQGENPTLCIVNSCTVTDEADRQSRKLASRLRAKNPEATVVMTGCAAEIDPERLAASPGIRYVVGNSDKTRLVELVLKALEQPKVTPSAGNTGEVLGQVRNYEQMLSRHPMDRDWPSSESQFAGQVLEQGNTLRTRTFLKIQEGCNSFCTYCIIPYGRGPSRSQDPSQILQSICDLTAKGVREVVLTGTNLGDYGVEWDDSPPGVALEKLVRRILERTPIERLRLGSLDPVEITPGLIRLVRESESRLCPHFHVSLQSPNSKILRAMKRKYTAVEVERTLEQIATELPEAFIGMDLITGFPTEGESEFRAGVQLLERLPWSRLHVFPYSERAGTPATRMSGAVPQALRVARARELNQLSLERQKLWTRNQVLRTGGSLSQVLFERPAKWGGAQSGGVEKRYWSGYTPNYLRVLASLEIQPETGVASPLWNQLVQVRAGPLLEDPQSHEVAIQALEIQAL